MTVKAYHVPVEDLGGFWPQASEFIDLALAKAAGEYTIKDVYEFIKRDWLALWVAYDTEAMEVVGALTIQIQIYPQKRVAMLVHLGAKDFSQIKGLFPRIERYCRENGCTSIMLWGRPGWSKVLSELGFEYRYSVLEKEI